MTAAAIEKATLFLPLAASSGVFAFRRADKGVKAMPDDPVFGAANIFIAGGQTLKGIRAAKDLTIESGNMSAADSIKAMDNSVVEAAKTNKFLKITGKLFDFISRNVNPLIVVAETIKVLNSDDKADAAVRAFLALACMFAGEGFAKRYMGMSYTKLKADGTRETVKREALYHKNPFIEKQVDAMKDYCETKKLFNKISMKSAPGLLKGLLFVGASIGCYAGGKGLATLLIGKEKPNKKSKTMNFTPNYSNNENQIRYANAA